MLAPSISSSGLAFQYVPHQRPPILSSNTLSSTRFKIIDRVFSDDSIPRYLLQQLPQHTFTILLRVTVFDLEKYVSKTQIEKFENCRYASGEDDYSSTKEWQYVFKRARRRGLDLFRRHANIEVLLLRNDLQANEEWLTTLKRAEAPTQSNLVHDGRQFSTTSSYALDVDLSEYEISGIISHRDVMGLRWYLVIWNGHSEHDATWLSEEDLDCAKDLIEQYWAGMEINQYAKQDTNSPSDLDHH